MLVFKNVNGLAPAFLVEPIQVHNPIRALRSSTWMCLRAKAVAAVAPKPFTAKLWDLWELKAVLSAILCITASNVCCFYLCMTYVFYQCEALLKVLYT